MTVQAPIYNSRLVKNYMEYIALHHPGARVESMLEHAGIRKYEVEDPAHWFTQEQVNRFHEVMATETKDPLISREVGRFSASSRASNPVKKYALGFLNPHAAYRLIANISSHLTKAFTFKVRKLGVNRVEVIATSNPGVQERPFQCENRMGMLEALARIFTNRLAEVEHPECMHRGGEVCRYFVTWEGGGSLLWKRLSRLAGLLSLLLAAGLYFVLHETLWAAVSLLFALLTTLLYFWAEHLEKKELASALEVQGDVAKERLEEINRHYSHAQLVQEIGQAASAIRDPEGLMRAAADAMKRHLGFDRGMLLLADAEKSHLSYKAGYGYDPEQEDLLRNAEFNVARPDSKGLFTLAFREQRPFLLDDVFRVSKDLSQRSLALAERMGVRSLICVPIAFEGEALGILAVDNVQSGKPLTQTDQSLLTGVASLIAVGMVNVLAFRKLEENERKYRDLVENASSIILRLDKQGNILFFNEFAQGFFGYAEREVVGRNAAEILFGGGEAGRQELSAMIGDGGLPAGRPTAQEIEHLKPNGERVWVAWTRRDTRDEEGRTTGLLCIGSDITRLKSTAEEKRELEVRLQRAQKMEAIGTLAGGVAHDLNNILAGIVSYPELLLMDLQPESPLVKPLLTIKKSGERAAGIVQDLLTLARRGVSTTQVVLLNQVVQEYVRSPEFRGLLAEHPGFELKASLAEDLFNIAGSPVHLSKTIMNLVTNAAEAMPGGGTVWITTGNRYVDRPVQGYDDVEEGDYVALSVSDNGVGISPQDLERIFEPFYTKKVMGRSGTGLGMAVVWGTVKDHHGYIDVQSTEGRGTTFTLYFPVTRRDPATEQIPRSIYESMGKGESVLVVDDVQEQRDLAVQLLKKLGYRVSSAQGGEQAVEYLKGQPADLLVLDMIMSPGIDGLEAYQRILQVRPGQRAIIVSGYSETGRVREAMRLGAGAYIKKPYALQSIAAAVRKELDRKA